MSGQARLEEVVHVVVAKPIAWTLYGLWQAGKWVCRGAIRFGRWAQNSWAEYRARREARRVRSHMNT